MTQETKSVFDIPTSMLRNMDDYEVVTHVICANLTEEVTVRKTFLEDLCNRIDRLNLEET